MRKRMALMVQEVNSMNQYEAVLLAMKQNGGYATLGQLYQSAPKIPESKWDAKVKKQLKLLYQQQNKLLKF